MNISIGYAVDRQWLRQQRHGAVEQAREVRALAAKIGQQFRPFAAEAPQALALDEQAQIGVTILDELNAGIAVAEQNQIDEMREPHCGKWLQEEMHLEADERFRVRRGPAQATDVVLSGREKQSFRPKNLTIRHLHRPIAGDVRYGTAAQQFGP